MTSDRSARRGRPRRHQRAGHARRQSARPLDMRAVARFANDPVYLWNGQRNALHWDIAGLFGRRCDGLAERAPRQSDNLVGIGVDSWAVDYGLLRDGSLLCHPASLPRRAHERRRRRRAQPSRRSRISIAATVFSSCRSTPSTSWLSTRPTDCSRSPIPCLLIPDLINYWLTGRPVTERTNASTTGLLGLDGAWDADLMDGSACRRSLFADIVEPGSPTRPGAARRGGAIGLAATAVAWCPSHRTTPPRRSPRYRCSRSQRPTSPAAHGGWSASSWITPVVTDRSRDANFTNEVGADGRVRFLHNVMGLWLLSRRPMRQYERDGRHRSTWPTLLEQAAACPPPPRSSTPTTRASSPPGDMPGRIGAWYRERGLPAPERPGRDGARDRGEPRRRIRSPVSTAARAVRCRVSKWSTSSAAGARTSCCVSSPPTGSGCRCWLDPWRPPRWATFC